MRISQCWKIMFVGPCNFFKAVGALRAVLNVLALAGMYERLECASEENQLQLYGLYSFYARFIVHFLFF